MIREAKMSDFNQVRELEMQLSNAIISARPDIFKQQQRWAAKEEYFKEMLEHGLESGVYEQKLFLYVEGETVLGYCQIDIEDETDEDEYDDEEYSTQHGAHVVWINSFFVAPQARGKGIAKSLFERVKAYTKDVGADRLELCFWGFDKELQGFYERLGMTVQSVAMELIIE